VLLEVLEPMHLAYPEEQLFSEIIVVLSQDSKGGTQSNERWEGKSLTVRPQSFAQAYVQMESSLAVIILTQAPKTPLFTI
jgi:hypothetical protein